MPVALSIADRDYSLGDLSIPLDLAGLAPGSAEWEIEIGFGKGRYLLKRASESPEMRFLGIEVANAYYQLALKRARRQGVGNLLLIRGEALFLLSAALPAAFATAVHVYFPDPWPKARHQKRRLFDAETVDLVLRLLTPGGKLFFATDFLDYGDVVHGILRGHPGVEVETREEGWEDGARTNYEAKYVEEGRPILRLEATRTETDSGSLLHPLGEVGVLAATASRGES